MEILVVTWNYPPRQGGMEQLLANLCRGLSHDHGVSVITAYAESNCVAGRETVLRPAKPGLLRFFLFAIVQGCALLHRSRNISVVFGGSVLVTPIVLLLARLFDRQAAIQAHGLDLIYRSWIYQVFVVRWLRYADRVITNSEHTAQLARRKGVSERALEIIPPGVDWKRFQVADSADVLKQARGLANRKVILFVGRLVRRKGVREFIDHSLLPIVRHVPDVCVVIAGDNPGDSLTHCEDMASEIRQAIDRGDSHDRVRMLGAVGDTELVQLYALCDVLVLPVLDINTDVEGFGMVALEAAAAGKPVVAFDCGGISDAVEDGITGILVEPGNYQRLAAVLISLLNDRDLASAMGRSGRDRAMQNFCWYRIAARYEDSLQVRV